MTAVVALVVFSLSGQNVMWEELPYEKVPLVRVRLSKFRFTSAYQVEDCGEEHNNDWVRGNG